VRDRYIGSDKTSQSGSRALSEPEHFSKAGIGVMFHTWVATKKVTNHLLKTIQGFISNTIILMHNPLHPVSNEPTEGVEKCMSVLDLED
jgi:hypothetical protein